MKERKDSMELRRRTKWKGAQWQWKCEGGESTSLAVGMTRGVWLAVTGMVESLEEAMEIKP